MTAVAVVYVQPYCRMHVYKPKAQELVEVLPKTVRQNVYFAVPYKNTAYVFDA